MSQKRKPPKEVPFFFFVVQRSFGRGGFNRGILGKTGEFWEMKMNVKEEIAFFFVDWYCKNEKEKNTSAQRKKRICPDKRRRKFHRSTLKEKERKERGN